MEAWRSADCSSNSLTAWVCLVINAIVVIIINNNNGDNLDYQCYHCKIMVIIVNMRVSRKKGVPQNGWIIMRNHIKMDDLGVPPFMETSNCIDNNDENKLVLST